MAVGMGTKRIMREFSMHEISGVDRPAQAGAKVAIMKRADRWDDSEFIGLRKKDFSAEQRRHAESTGAAMPGGRYPIESKSDLENAIHAIGRGKGSHAAIRAHITRRAKALGASDMLPDDWKAEKALPDSVFKYIDGAYEVRASLLDQVRKGAEFSKEFATEIGIALKALCASNYEVMDDASLVEKASALQEGLAEFFVYAKKAAADETQSGFVKGAIEKAGFSFSASGNPELVSEGASSMALKDIAKKLGLGESATEAEIMKAMDEAEEKAKKAKDEEAEKAKKAEKSAKTLESILKMSDKHSAFMNNEKAKMPEGGKAAFADMSSEQRDAHMSANPVQKSDSEDDVEKQIAKGLAFKSGDAVIKRSDFPTEAGFNFAKSQADTIAKQGADLAKAAEENAVARIEKRLTPLKNIGKTADNVALVRTVEKADPKAAEAMMVKFEETDAAIAKSALFNEAGSAARGAQFGKAGETIQKHAEELRKKNTGWSIEKCRNEVRKGNPELAKEETQEAEEARANKGRRAA